MVDTVVYNASTTRFEPTDDDLPAAAALSDAISNPTSPMVGAAGMGFNGTNWERHTHNLEITALASAAITGTRNSGSLSNFNCRGVVVFVNVTLVPGAAPSTTVSIQTVDPIGGGFTSLLTSAAITGVGLTQLVVYPGATVAANLAASSPLSRTWRVLATHGNANSMTYSVSASLIL